jgi:hypothetical protein
MVLDIIVTDVTIWGDRNCVAGWCWAQNRMIRPLPNYGEFWAGQYAGPHLFQLGNIVRIAPLLDAPLRRGLPHSREDVITASVPQLVGQVSSNNLAEALSPSVSPTILSIFGGQMHDNYVDEGADCSSLGAVDVPAKNIGFVEEIYEGRRKLRCSIRDDKTNPFTWEGIPHRLKVSSKFLQDTCENEGIDALNSPLIKSNPSMIGTTFWATFPHSGLYAVCLRRSQEFINGLLTLLR